MSAPYCTHVMGGGGHCYKRTNDESGRCAQHREGRDSLGRHQGDDVSKNVWELTPDEAAARFGVELESVRERSRILYLIADSRRDDRMFEARWKGWERGRNNMPVSVQQALENPEQADQAIEAVKATGAPLQYAAIVTQRLVP